jgi:type IV pilus assembly protein PilM
MVGLDIGSGAVKGVTLKKSRAGWSLVAAAEVPLPVAGPHDSQTTQDAAVSETVSEVFDALRLRRARVATALSGHAVIVKRLSLPSMSRAELAEAIPWEAEQYIPFDLSDVQIDYQVVNAPNGDAAKSTVDVLLVAAKKDRIEDRAALVSQSGRQPVVLDVEAFALANAYRVNYPERVDPLTALVHVGRTTTLVCLLEQGEPIFTRDIALGGQAHIDALMRDPSMQGLDELAVRRALHGTLPGGVDADRVQTVLKDASMQLIREVRKSIDFFRTSATVERLTRVILSGGAWEAAGLVDLLTTEFSAPVDIFDPFRRVTRPSRALGADAVGPSYAVAVGLAMRSEGDR